MPLRSQSSLRATPAAMRAYANHRRRAGRVLRNPTPDSTLRTGYALAITVDGGDPIGSVGLTIDSANPRLAEIGFTVHADHWGRGYATESGRALLAFGLDSLGLARVNATCRPGNIASARALASMGMQQTALLKDHKLIRGHWQDSLLFEATSE